MPELEDARGCRAQATRNPLGPMRHTRPSDLPLHNGGARRPLLLFIALAAACAAPPDGTGERSGAEAEAPTAPPRFEDLPAGNRYHGPPAAIDLDSHPLARTFQTALHAGAAKGPNLAGDLTVVSWGCGTMCQRAMVVDAATGRVLAQLDAPLGWAFRRDSDLLIENPPERVAENPCPACRTRYLIRSGEGLLPVPEGAFPPAVMDPHSRGLVIRTRARESPALAGSAPAAVRDDWSSLRLRARDGSFVELRDHLDGVELRDVHRLAETVEPLDAWIVERIYVPEGGDWLMIGRASGEITVLDAEPAVDPTGRWFATASADLVAGHAPNRVRIYRASTRAAGWAAEPRDWGARAPRWVDPVTLELDRVVVRWSTHGEFVSPMRVRWTGSTWAAVPDPRHAADVLRGFFDALAAGRYAEASRHYGGGYEVLRGWNPEVDPDDVPELWEMACRHNGLQCLPDLEILGLSRDGPAGVVAAVRFLLSDGREFVVGPCCGATPAEMPPRSEFEFRLRLEDGRWLVEDLPVYVP